jgi:hypothetical protein
MTFICIIVLTCLNVCEGIIFVVFALWHYLNCVLFCVLYEINVGYVVNGWVGVYYGGGGRGYIMHYKVKYGVMLICKYFVHLQCFFLD